MNLHIIMHESFECPGAILYWASSNKCRITYTRLYKGDTLPDNCDQFDFLFILGGPQSTTTTTKECPHFNAKKEIAFIKKAIKKDKWILGICLGAQLLGEAYGAATMPSPEREIGVFRVILTPEGKSDPLFEGFPNNFPVGHWHADMPGLTTEATVLAVSAGCPRQIIRYSPKVYGFQCHFEFTSFSIDDMVRFNFKELETYKHLPYVELAYQVRTQNYMPMNQLLCLFLDKVKAKFELEKK